MPLLNPEQRAFAEAASDLTYCNPFEPRRIECERRALGDEYVDAGPVWRRQLDEQIDTPNVERIGRRVERLVEEMHQRLRQGVRPRAGELELYKALVSYLLYYRCIGDFLRVIERRSNPTGKLVFYERFVEDARRYFGLPGVFGAGGTGPEYQPAHLFACFFHVRRAFHYIFRYILGGSLAAARLRSSIWESIFTHDMRRYRRGLYERLGDVTTLITGPSGTGKELVARAVGLSRFIPFDSASWSFQEDFESSFYSLNLSALSPTLIESELFGHRRGAFTGAVQDRAGWLEVCPPLGTVFLDEIGEVDLSIQVKLLRVLQSRCFQRLGETEDRRFQGKVVAATNRDLRREMERGRFREDLYYRLCSDLITTPSLVQSLREAPEELYGLTLYIARRVAGPEEAEAVASEVVAWVEGHLGLDYEWPGNVRELEQCVKNVLIRKSYHPPGRRAGSVDEELAADFTGGRLSADEVLCRYCTVVYAQTGSYVEAARRTGLDRRTVKARIDESLLERLRGAPPRRA